MLACQEYTRAIDVWSVGCIFAELLARAPLFPGEDYIAQLRLICDKLGRPADDRLDFVTSERARKFMLSLPQKASTPMSELFPQFKNEVKALDLMKRMLEIHPSSRITIQQCLEHPFLASLHNDDDEPVADFTFSFEFENEELPRERVRELIWDELRTYHPHIPATHPSPRISQVKSRTSETVPLTADSKADVKSECDDNRAYKDSKSGTSLRKRSISPPSGNNSDSKAP
jgi:serine/threonine protein kinase